MTGLHDAIRGAGLAALALTVMIGAGPAHAEGTVFGGALLGDTQTEYLGVSVPLPGARVGQGLAIRGIVSGSQYTYDAFVGRVRGKDVRADVSLLYQISDAHNYVDVGIGPRYVDVRLSPRDPGNSRAGGHWEGVVSLSGQQSYAPWYASEFGSYGTDGRDYFVRGDLTRTIAGPLRLGIEAQADGARDYSRRGVGAVLAAAISPRCLVKLSGGATSQSHRSGGYGGITFQAPF